MIGGSPCQDLSIAKKGRKGLAGDRSGLFWEFVRIRDLIRPRAFLLENVASMSKDDRDIITEALGVEPILIDASLVSAQSRKRLFWTNLPVTLPADRGICLRDILQPEADVDPSMFVKDARLVKDGGGRSTKLGHIGATDGQANRVYSTDGKSVTLSANGGGSGAKTGLYAVGQDTEMHRIRKLTPVECERLQGLPDEYTAGVAKTHRYKALGNAFNVDVIAHILSFYS
jgi:DNA (cytosine-5)-methyltransferase 3A